MTNDALCKNNLTFGSVACVESDVVWVCVHMYVCMFVCMLPWYSLNVLNYCSLHCPCLWLPDYWSVSYCWAQRLHLPDLGLHIELGFIVAQWIIAKWKNGQVICTCTLVNFFLRVLSPCLYVSVALSSCPLSLHLFLWVFCCLLFLLHFSPHNPILDTYT